MRKFGLIGHPLGHSLSPQIHDRLFKLSGETVEYKLYDIPPEKLSENYPLLETLDGFNITIPHKVAIIDYCDKLTEGANRYRSVNCVKHGAEKLGCNTDVIGFTKSIAALGASLSEKILLIGCGGVGRMMAIEACMNGAELTIAALPSDKPLAGKVTEEIKVLKPDAKVNTVIIKGGSLDVTDFEGTPDFSLVINACPVGMFPKIDRMPCTPAVLDGVKYVFDAVYNPSETLLAKTAREKGAKAMTGMAMLVLQAVAAHEIWDGAEYDKSDIDRIIADMEALV